jgi:hypothetical protein
VLAAGDEVKGIDIGDYVIANAAVGECFKDATGKKLKSMESNLIAAVFSPTELEYAKQLKRI